MPPLDLVQVIGNIGNCFGLTNGEWSFLKPSTNWPPSSMSYLGRKVLGQSISGTNNCHTVGRIMSGEPCFSFHIKLKGHITGTYTTMFNSEWAILAGVLLTTPKVMVRSLWGRWNHLRNLIARCFLTQWDRPFGDVNYKDRQKKITALPGQPSAWPHDLLLQLVDISQFLPADTSLWSQQFSAEHSMELDIAMQNTDLYDSVCARKCDSLSYNALPLQRLTKNQLWIPVLHRAFSPFSWRELLRNYLVHFPAQSGTTEAQLTFFTI